MLQKRDQYCKKKDLNNVVFHWIVPYVLLLDVSQNKLEIIEI